MPFRLNTRNHFKIWLGPLKLENKLRLQNFRALNPQAKLSLIYDKNLLNDTELEDLIGLCLNIKIQPVEVEAELLPQCRDFTEFALIDLYREAIKPQKEGGNFGSASDLLRWLTPSLELGSYSDLDVLIDTQGFPEFVEVDQPLLLNIGSLQQFGLEFSAINNDLIAIADLKAALPDIRKIQQEIILASRPNFDGRSYLELNAEKTHAAVLKDNGYYLGKFMSYYLEEPSQELIDLNKGRSAPETQAEIIRLTETEELFCQENYDLCAAFKFLGQLVTLNQVPDLFTKRLRENTRTELLLNNVVSTTGPLTVLNVISPNTVYTQANFAKTIAPYAISYHNLSSLYNSGNSIPLHTNGWLYLPSGSQNNDLSWLERGEALRQKRESALTNLTVEQPPRFIKKPNNNTALIDELTSIAEKHNQQKTALKLQYLMNNACEKSREVEFSDCRSFEGSDVCVTTKVKLVPTSYFAMEVNEPTEYLCTKAEGAQGGWLCTLEKETPTCALSSAELWLPAWLDFTRHVSNVAIHSALRAVIPEAIGDALSLSGLMKKENAALIAPSINLALMIANNTWIEALVGTLFTLLAERHGEDPLRARLTGNILALTIRLNYGFSYTSLYYLFLNSLSANLALDAEKLIVKQLKAYLQEKTLEDFLVEKVCQRQIEKNGLECDALKHVKKQEDAPKTLEAKSPSAKNISNEVKKKESSLGNSQHGLFATKRQRPDVVKEETGLLNVIRCGASEAYRGLKAFF